MGSTRNALRSGASLSVLAIAAPLALLATNAFAGSLPTKGQYVAGSGAIQSSANGLTIDQNSTRGIIDWQSFSIGKGKTVQFDNGSGATLNRVTGNNLSQIAGSLKATGSVYLVNPSGVIVMPTGQVLTQGSFVASTRNVSNGAFMSGGGLQFSGSSSGNVTNEGSIGSAGGNAVLIGNDVTNTGTIHAAQGNAALAAGDSVVLQPGSGQVLVRGGKGNVRNSGGIVAAQAELDAAGGNVYALAGNNGGVIRATGTSTRDGHVWLTAGGTTTISGAIAAKDANGSGGTIVATGKAVDLQSTANIDASGTRGGTVLIGGDQHGGTIASEKLVAQNVPTANSTNIANGARISANGSAGQGGSVVVWSNKATRFAGTISERGSAGTRGGFAEVSSHDVLAFDGHVDLTSFQGATGTLLLDPYNVTISNHANRTETCTGGVCTPSGNNSILNVTTLENLLATTNVDVTTGGTGSLGSQAGDITVAAALSWSSSNTLTLDAYHSILIDNSVSITGAGGLDVITNDGGTGGTFLFGPAGNVTFANLSSNLTIDGAAYTLVSNIATLASDIAAHPSGDFALANSYNAGADGTYSTSPITTAFSGTFDGLGNTISNLSIDDAATAQAVGLFSFVNTGGEIANVVLSNANVQAGTDPYEGALVGLNYGLVIGDSASGSVGEVTGAIRGIFGGLIGYNVGGKIEDSSSSAAVSCGYGCSAGGLLGFNIEGSGVAIDYSYATGTVLGGDDSLVGGLIGRNENSGIANSYATGSATGGTGSEVGGLVGDSESSSISNSHALGIVNGGLDSLVGGLVGGDGSSITGSYATGAVSGIDESFAGGLVGEVFGGKITNSYASGNVTDGDGYYSDAGGLVGYAQGTKFAGDSATGSVTGGEGASAGGLIGYMKKVSINNSFATGTVAVGAGYSSAGGLVGQEVSGSIANSYAGGPVTAGENSYAGGLVGESFAASSSIANSYATGSVTETANGGYLGGLVGFFYGSISNSYAIGAVTGGIGSEVGGLVGESDGTITGSHASGSVMCGESCDAGGLVASNYGTISSSYATGSATGGDYSDAGGLAAGNDGTIENSYATGNVSVGNGIGGVGGGIAGGLVGENDTIISGSFATGAVSGGSVTSVGGLVGFNLGTAASVTNSYATGSATGGSNSAVGGLMGFNDDGSISDSYSTGAPVGGSGSYVGGLVGEDYGTETDNYWDTTTSGITNLSQGAGNIANDPGITGLTTAQLQSGLPAGFSSSIWGENASINNGLPYLLGNPPPARPAGFDPLMSDTNPDFNGEWPYRLKRMREVRIEKMLVRANLRTNQRQGKAKKSNKPFDL